MSTFRGEPCRLFLLNRVTGKLSGATRDLPTLLRVVVLNFKTTVKELGFACFEIKTYERSLETPIEPWTVGYADLAAGT